jgi:hypothetical protein
MKTILIGLFLISYNILIAQLQFEEKLATIPIQHLHHNIDGLNYGKSIVGDVDGDGDLDVFNIGRKGYNFYSTLYINNGQGEFHKDITQSFMTAMQCDAEFIDVDNDGDLDILIAGGQSGGSTYKNALYINNGSGQFTLSTDFATQVVQFYCSSSRINVGDLNNDGSTDFILHNSYGSADSTYVYLNDGLGNFQLHSSGIASSISSGYYDVIRLIDYNSNGFLDYCTIKNDCTLIIHSNDGNGNFTSFTPTVFDTLKTMKINYNYYNSDAFIDFIATVYNEITMEKSNIIGLSDGVGGFAYSIIPENSSNFLSYSFSIDTDGDLDIDLVGINNQGKGVYLKNDGLGNFSIYNHIGQFPRILEKWFSNLNNVNVVDFNNDGFNDIISYGIIDGEESLFDVYLNDGAGNFYLVFDNYISPAAFSDSDLGDFDNDGDLDLITIGIDNSIITLLYENVGDGGFVKNSISDMFTKVHRGSCEFLNINNDNFLDLIITGDYGINDENTRCFLNDQSGGLVLISHTLPIVSNSQTKSFDIDNDGDDDVLIAGQNDANYFCNLYLNNNGQFQLIKQFTPIINPTFDIADIDGDGYLDILINGEIPGFGNKISNLYKNDGQLDFVSSTLPLPLSLGTEYLSVFGDFNNDGKPDVFHISYNTSSVHYKIFINDGAGNFTLNANFIADTLIKGTPHIEDFNLDGYDDLVIYGGNNGNAMAIFLNDFGNGFVYQNLNLPSFSLGTVSTGDLNGDGLPDLFYTGNYMNNMIAKVYINTSVVTLIEKPEVNRLNFSIFPNPTQNILNVNIKETFTEANIQIFNLVGEMVYYQDVNTVSSSIDVGRLADGMYLMRLNLDGKIASKTFVVTK